MKSRSLIGVILGVLMVAMVVTGCGKKESIQKKGDDEGPWFETEFHDFKLSEDEFVPTICMYENEMYFVIYRKDTNTENRLMTLKKMSLDNYTVSDVKTFSSNDTGVIFNICADESGIYLTGQNIRWNSEHTKVLGAEYKIILCQKDGTVQKSWDITEDLADRNSEEEAVYLSDMACDREGNIYLTDNATFVMAYDNQGKKIADISCDNWGNGFLLAENGQMYYSYTGGISMKQCLSPIDIKSNKLGKKAAEMTGYMPYNYCIDANDTLWYSNETSLLTYNLKTKENREILSWLDYDMTTDSVRMLNVMEDGSIVICVESLMKEQLVYEVAVFKETDQPITDKVMITYATFGADTDIMEAIVRFNKNSEEYRVKVVDYYDEENYEEAWNEYNQAILEEGFADIVNVGWANYEMMAEKGLYENLNEFMEKDGIDRKDYFENILSAYDINGNLYAMPISFSISTLVGKEQIWGDKETLSLADIQTKIEQMPKDTEIMEGMTQEMFMFLMLQGSLDKFVDWEKGECYFESPEFVEIMNISKKFPKKADWDLFSNDMVNKFRNDKILLYDCELYGISDYQMIDEILGDEIIALGYPGANGGLIQTEGSLLAISEASLHKDIAWEFVKNMISEEYQCNYIYSNSPIHKGAFEKQLEDAMEKVIYTDENGKEIEQSKMSYVYDDLEIEIYAATGEEVEAYKKIVESATTLATYDQQIMLIVEEEMEAFWDNKKTAEEVAGIIQSRAEIYVNERR